MSIDGWGKSLSSIEKKNQQEKSIIFSIKNEKWQVFPSQNSIVTTCPGKNIHTNLTGFFTFRRSNIGIS